MNGWSARRWVLLLCAVAFLLRAGVVLAPSATLYGTPIGGDPGVKIGEEIARGNLAADVLGGTLMPLVDYQYAPFFGGSLVVGLLTVPIFAIFGTSLWALKLVPVLIHLAGVTLLFRLLDSHVSRRAAICGGLLFAATPPGYTLLTTINWGSHVESNLLALLALGLHLDLRASAHRVRHRFGLGLVLGFGLYFGYQTALIVATLLVFDGLQAVRPRWREALAQGIGMLIGCTPWWIYNLRHEFAGLNLYGASLQSHWAASAAPARLWDLLANGLPRSLFASHRGLELAWYLTLAVLALFGIALGGARARPARVAAVFFAIFAFAYSLSDFELGARPTLVTDYRYAMQLAPWVAIASACGMDQLAARGPRLRIAAWVAAFGLAATCFVATWVSSCDPGRLGADRHAPGVDLASHGRWLCLKHLHQQQRIPQLVERIVARRNVQDQAILFRSMGGFLRDLGQVWPGASERKRAEARRMNVTADLFAEVVPPEFRESFRARRGAPP